MVELKRRHCTARSTVLAVPPAMFTHKGREGLDPMYDGVYRGRAVMACRRGKSREVMALTWNVSSMLRRSSEVVDTLHRRKIDFCCAQETK